MNNIFSTTRVNRFALKSFAIALLFMFTACGEKKPVAQNQTQTTPDTNVLFWSLEKRDAAFRDMEKRLPSRVVSAGGSVAGLPDGKKIAPSWIFAGQSWETKSYMQDQRAAGVIVVHNGQVRLEQYGLDFSAEQRWTSFSVAKSFTSTLVGAAIKDGYIKSIDDQLTLYIPELAGSGYDGVTVQQLLTMQSGVQWNEDYSDPKSDVAQFLLTKSVDGVDPTILYMKNLRSEVEPGSRWQYNTGETNLIGVLVSKASGKTLSDYLSEKVWQPYGMEMDAIWLLNDGGAEIGGCCFSARLRDYARFGLFALGGGMVNGESIVPDGWFEAAGTKQAGIDRPGFGYGYQWWTYDDGSFAAQGIFGQGVFIDPKRNLVIASNSNWLTASPDKMKDKRNAFYAAVQAAVDNGE